MQTPTGTSTTGSLAINGNSIFFGCFDIFFIKFCGWVFLLEQGRKIIAAAVLINHFYL